MSQSDIDFLKQQFHSMKMESVKHARITKKIDAMLNVLNQDPVPTQEAMELFNEIIVGQDPVMAELYRFSQKINKQFLVKKLIQQNPEHQKILMALKKVINFEENDCGCGS